MNRKGLDFTFSWIFAIIAGAVILFSAIYITTKLIGSDKVQGDTFVAAELSNILSPVETNLEDSKYSLIKFTADTRVFNDCSSSGPFGKQEISTASRSRIGADWGKKSVPVHSFNRYVFSREIEETNEKKMRVLSSPLEMPFKIGDAIIMYGGNYCFVNPPDDIEENFMDLSSNGAQDIGINISSTMNTCPLNYTTVCFNANGCDVKVNTVGGIVSKYGVDLYYYGDSLELGAIFSDPEVYECQVKRLAKRAGELGVVYRNKASYVEGSGCSNNLVSDLQSFVLATNVTDSRDFGRITQIADSLEEKNDGLASCKIF